MVIPKEVVTELVRIGHDFSDQWPVPAESCAHLVEHSKLDMAHWSAWDVVCTELGIEDLVALSKGVVIAEETCGWRGGSVAAAIWVFRNVERRQYPELGSLANWILNRTSSPYIPFGTRNFGARSLLTYQYHRESHQNSIDEGIRQQAETEAAAAAWRSLRKSQRKAAHIQRKSEARTTFIRELSQVGIFEQLSRFLDDESLPVEYYPASLAGGLNEAILNQLDEALLLKLLHRLKGKRRGPWLGLKKRVRSCLTSHIQQNGMPWDMKPWFR
jgi:hypothetical protein